MSIVIETHMACAAALCSLLLDRLQYFARGLQVYIRQLRVALQGKTGDALKTEEVTTLQEGRTFSISLNLL